MFHGPQARHKNYAPHTSHTTRRDLFNALRLSICRHGYLNNRHSESVRTMTVFLTPPVLVLASPFLPHPVVNEWYQMSTCESILALCVTRKVRNMAFRMIEGGFT